MAYYEKMASDKNQKYRRWQGLSLLPILKGHERIVEYKGSLAQMERYQTSRCHKWLFALPDQSGGDWRAAFQKFRSICQRCQGLFARGWPQKQRWISLWRQALLHRVEKEDTCRGEEILVGYGREYWNQNTQGEWSKEPWRPWFSVALTNLVNCLHFAKTSAMKKFGWLFWPVALVSCLDTSDYDIKVWTNAIVGRALGLWRFISKRFNQWRGYNIYKSISDDLVYLYYSQNCKPKHQQLVLTI